jgi:hypothetical protein
LRLAGATRWHVGWGWRLPAATLTDDLAPRAMGPAIALSLALSPAASRFAVPGRGRWCGQFE